MAKNKIGVVEVKGIISDSKEIVSQIVNYRNDPSIEAIILRIDSPGGAVGPSQEIYSEVKINFRFKFSKAQIIFCLISNQVRF